MMVNIHHNHLPIDMKTRSMYAQNDTEIYQSLENSIQKRGMKRMRIDTPNHPIVKESPHTPKKVRSDRQDRRSNFVKQLPISKVMMLYVDGNYSTSFTDDEGLFGNVHVNITTPDSDEFNSECQFEQSSVCRRLNFETFKEDI